MKKHPIDELFASNLRDHSAVPSSRAAELFQQRLTEKKKPKGIFFKPPAKNYYWAAAASVLFVLTIGWYVVQNEQTTQTVAEQLNKTEVVNDPAMKPKVNPVEKITAPAIDVQENEKALSNTTQIAKVSKVKKTSTSVIKARNEITQEVELKKNTPVFAPMVLDEPIMDKLTVAVLNAEQEKKRKATKQRKLQNENNILFKKSIAETVIVISEVQPKEEQLYIPEISGDSRVTIAQATKMGQERQEADRSFIAKVFTEIKHLKHGEKLDVAGLNKKSDAVFTRSNEGFIANEKEELTYRLGKLREVFSKNDLR
jgi:stalled ribosome alternative rescue factor ArfA